MSIDFAPLHHKWESGDLAQAGVRSFRAFLPTFVAGKKWERKNEILLLRPVVTGLVSKVIFPIFQTGAKCNKWIGTIVSTFSLGHLPQDL